MDIHFRHSLVLHVYLLLDDIMVVATEGDRRYLGSLWIHRILSERFVNTNSVSLLDAIASFSSKLCLHALIGASLSEPHASRTALQDACLCLFVCGHILEFKL